MDRFTLLFPLAWRNLWRNPRRTLITLTVVAVGMWSILIFGVMMKAMALSSREQALRVLTGEGEIHASGYVDDPSVSRRMTAPAGAFKGALDSPQVRTWTARVRVPAVVQSEYRTRTITLVGVEPSSERRISDLPTSIVLGRYLSGDADAGFAIGRDLAKRLKTRLGKRLIVMAQDENGHLAEQSFSIVGIFASTRPVEDEFTFTGRKTAQKMLGIGGDISEISFDVATEQKLPATVAALKKAAPHYDVRPWTEFAPIAFAIEGFSQTYVAAWLLIMFILMAIGIVNTQLMAVFERTREFGLLRALGMRARFVLLQVALESFLLVGAGIACGIAATLLTLLPFRNGVDLSFLSAGIEMYGFGRILHPVFDLGDTARSVAIIWFLGVIASLWPARAAARADPVVAMAES